jgi:4-aminobutyrate aminotransferase-like enzyme
VRSAVTDFWSNYSLERSRSLDCRGSHLLGGAAIAGAPNAILVLLTDVEALEETIDEETAGLILEPVQGEGGINSASTESL